MDIFNRLAPFIQDYIYQNKWEELRGIQIAAAEAIFDTNDNLLLSSGTASGKTEAAFLPVLTQLHENPSKSVGVIYISPLKALINDQFKRLEQLLIDAHIPVTRWHGDASQTKKDALVKKPQGILQITPESLESLVTGKRGACINMFSDLRYVIIDEVHYFMRDARGVQLLCVLERLQQLVNIMPRRIGLSATLGDAELAKNWLNTGSYDAEGGVQASPAMRIPRNCLAPVTSDGKKRLRLHIERFVNHADKRDLEERDGSGLVVNSSVSGDMGAREHYEYLFKMTLDKKTIVFANSREEIELVMANMKEIALRNKSPDVYRVHHGNVSAFLRESAEDEMKDDDEKIVTGATVTLELGIDIGGLDQAVQIGSPSSVASFAQRLGRCGRRGQVPQLLFTFVEDLKVNSDDSLALINWEFLRTIAIIELYTRNHWVEPIPPHRHPYHLLYHQTMSHLKSCGELSPAALAQAVLTLGSFQHIPQEDYRTLLAHLINIDQLERTERGGIIIGREGEKIINSHKFLTVFEAPEYLLVKDENRTIGTVDKVYPVGIRFALAGMTWETVDVNANSKVLFVKHVPGIALVDWNIDFEVDMHPILVKKVRDVLDGGDAYPYLSARCVERLAEIRYMASNSGILNNLVTPLARNRYAIFPWVGTRQLFTLHYALLNRRIVNSLPWITCLYLEAQFEGTQGELEAIIYEILNSDLNMYDLPLPDDVQVKGKYNEFVPQSLLRKQFVEDYLDFNGLREYMKV